MPQSGTFSSQSNEESGDDGREGAGYGASVNRKASGTITHDATRNSTGSLDGTAQEGCATFLLHGRIEGGLATHKRAVCDAGGVGKGRSELDVLVEDIAGARPAQLVCGKGGLDAKECEVFFLELFQVRDDHLLFTAARVLGSNRCPKTAGGGFCRTGEEALAGSIRRGPYFENAIVSAIVFGTDGLRQGVEGVEDVISADHVRVERCGELV